MEFSFEITDEQEEFARKVVRPWLDENVPPGLEPIRDPLKMSHEQWAMRRDFKRKLGAKGWLYATYDRKHGGGGLDGGSGSVIVEEMAKRGIGAQPIQEWAGGAVAGIMGCATEEQKLRFLPTIFGGETTTWQLFTEPEAGTDVANQQINALRYTRDGDYFIVNGQKIFVGGTHPPTPELFYLLSRSDLDAPRHENLSCFLCPADLPGVTIQPLDLFTPVPLPFAHGVTGANLEANKNTVFFDNVKIHESCLIGAEGDGWKVAMATLTGEHGGVSQAPARAPRQERVPAKARVDREEGTGPRNHIADAFFAQCKNNPRVVKRLRENPQLIGNVVDVYIYAQTERAFKLRDIGGMGGAYGGPQAMVYQKQKGTKFAADMAAVLGPYALTNDDEWGPEYGIFEVAQRCAVCLAPAGTPEALKIVVSRALSIGR